MILWKRYIFGLSIMVHMCEPWISRSYVKIYKYSYTIDNYRYFSRKSVLEHYFSDLLFNFFHNHIKYLFSPNSDSIINTFLISYYQVIMSIGISSRFPFSTPWLLLNISPTDPYLWKSDNFFSEARISTSSNMKQLLEFLFSS